MLQILLRHPIKIVVYSVHPWDPLKQKYRLRKIDCIQRQKWRKLFRNAQECGAAGNCGKA